MNGWPNKRRLPPSGFNISIQHRPTLLNSASWTRLIPCWSNDSACLVTLLIKWFCVFGHPVDRMILRVWSPCWSNDSACLVTLLIEWFCVFGHPVDRMILRVWSPCWSNDSACLVILLIEWFCVFGHPVDRMILRVWSPCWSNDSACLVTLLIEWFWVFGDPVDRMILRVWSPCWMILNDERRTFNDVEWCWRKVQVLILVLVHFTGCATTPSLPYL